MKTMNTQLTPILGLTVAHINVHSIKNKLDEVNIMLQSMDIDVLTCSKTWLHEGIEDSCLSIENNIFFRQDQNYSGALRKGGGLLTYIKKYTRLMTPYMPIQILAIETWKPNF